MQLLLTAGSICLVAASCLGLVMPGANCTFLIHVHTPACTGPAAVHGITPMEVQARLTAFFKSLGVAAVLDIADAREVALSEAAQEFVDRCG